MWRGASSPARNPGWPMPCWTAWRGCCGRADSRGRPAAERISANADARGDAIDMNTAPLHRITDEDRARFAEDGAVCLRGMVDEEWLARMRAAVDRVMDADHALARRREVTKALGGTTGRFQISSFIWRWDDDFRDWVMHGPCAAIAAEIMGADEVRLFYDQLFVKEPNTVEMTDWHQDLPFWPLAGN